MFATHTTKINSPAEQAQSDRLGRRLPLIGTRYQTPAAPFDGGCS